MSDANDYWKDLADMLGADPPPKKEASVDDAAAESSSDPEQQAPDHQEPVPGPAETEGVETTEQLDMLKKLACDAFQGYLVSEPVAPSAFASLLQNPPDTAGI